jgi:hypothetical protein
MSPPCGIIMNDMADLEADSNVKKMNNLEAKEGK